MTKVLILSDSHGLKKELETIVNKHKDEVDAFIHCGDSELDHNDSCLQPFYVVGGNCDFKGKFPLELTKEIGGYRFFITHGHLYSVKSSLMKLMYRAEELDAQIICFGHSHLLGAEMVHNKLLINPGSIRKPRGRKEKTYCLLELNDDKVELRVFEVGKGELENLRHTFTFQR